MLILKKYQTHIVLLFLMIAGFWLRFHLACVKNVATDEIATLVTASQMFPKGIIYALVTKNFHAPLYYILLHFWMLLFGDSTMSLRMMPVLFGTLCIPAAYACGKELVSKFAGFSVAILVTVNAFMINYSYFGKFYALLELLGFLSIYFIIRISKNPLKKYFVCLACINACIIYTYVTGFVFVGIQFLIFAGYDFIVQKKQNWRRWLGYAVGVILLTGPVIPMMWMTIRNTQSAIAPGFWWYEYEKEHILTVIMTWFSPAVPIGFTGTNTEIIQRFKGHLGWSVLWNVLPTLLASAVVYVTVRKKKILDLLLLTTCGFLLCEWIAALAGRFAFIPRHTLLVFPALILCIGAGVALFEKRVFAYAVLNTFLFVNMGYLYAFSNMDIPVPPNKVLTLARHLENLQLDKGDKVILPMRGYLLTYFYHPKDVDILSFDLNYTLKTGDRQIISKLYSAQDIDTEQTTVHGKFRRYIDSQQPTEAISNYLRQHILIDLREGNRVILVDNCENKPKPKLKPKSKPRFVIVVEDNQANGKMSDGMFFNALCEKVSADVKAVLKQNKFQITEFIPDSNISVYRPIQGEYLQQ